ncbi:MAG TPA: DNA replication/repair protein RecF [Tissierellales bacterium]|nr:DNA replication/repair protein RecF [Tissierellales bacterium]
MYVKNLRLINFRNYGSLNIQLNKGVNLFIGKNAQGKTNLLESIYFCSTGKSFKTNSDKDIINFNKNVSYIGALLKSQNKEKLIEIKLDRNKTKIIRINKVELEKHKRLHSGLNVVIFSPEDLRLIKDGPFVRRNFLDMEIIQIKPLYEYNISRYNKILFQRNNLLKSKKNNGQLLDIFDFQLANIGTEIIIERNKFINDLSYVSNLVHKKLTNNMEDLTLNYITNVTETKNVKDIIEKDFLYRLKQNRKRDLFKGTTGIGPHRDDIKILINDLDTRSFASQGQQRTAVLSIKLAEVELIKKEKGEYPILLLDDVLSELDEDRRKYLINNFSNLQTIVTSTDVIEIEEMEDIKKKIFYINNGDVYEKGDI